MINKRKNLRIPLQIKSQITTEDGTTFQGLTSNISFGGIYLDLKQEHKLKIGDPCTITLTLDGGAGCQSIIFKAGVIHVSGKEAGLKFTAIEGIDCYEHFKNLMVANSPEPSLLLEELKTSPGIIVS